MKVASRSLKSHAAGLLAMAMAGCGGGGASPVDTPQPAPSSASGLDQIPLPPLCAFMPNGTTVSAITDATCVGCTVQDESLAIDGSLDTFATLKATVLRGGGTLRATAPAGTAFDALNQPGAFVQRPDPMGASTIFVRTYLDGQLQESLSFGSSIGSVGRDRIFYGFSATKPFDAIEFSLTTVPDAGGDLLVNEFCIDGGAE